MKMKQKILLSAVIGGLGGIAAWSPVEGALHLQNQMHSIILANILFGVIAGIIFGFFLGSIEGVLFKSGAKLRKGIFWGMLLGIIGGAFGLFAGRFIIVVTGDIFFRMKQWYSPVILVLIKSAGWSIFGAAIGVSGGIVLRSKGKILQGALGGLTGGFIGGLAFELIVYQSSAVHIARLFGLTLMGLLIGLFLALAEKILSQGVLRLLNGKMKGKEFDLSYNRIKIGRSESCDVGLFGFKNVVNRHAEIKKEEGGFVIYDAEAPEGTLVNEQPVKQKNLKSGDIIQLGDAKLLFLAKEN